MRPLERPDALNSAVEGERDLGVSLMWASLAARAALSAICVSQGLKGSGDYGVAAAGPLLGTGLESPGPERRRARAGARGYPFKTVGGQFYELGGEATTATS